MKAAELRQAIAAIAEHRRDLRVDPVETPEWPEVDGHIFVRSLTQRERELYLASLRREAEKEGDTIRVDAEAAGVKLAAFTMCDSDGETIFTLDDAKMLEERSSACMTRVIDKAGEINGFGRKAREAAKNSLPSPVTNGLVSV